jgi:hypothetical protein
MTDRPDIPLPADPSPTPPPEQPSARAARAVPIRVEVRLGTGSAPIDVRLPPKDTRPDPWQKAGVIGSIISSLSVIALGVGLWLTYQANRQAADASAQQAALARQAQISDRFAAGIEHLGSTQLDVRLGGIYSLERLSADSPSDQAVIVEVLSAFVRDHAARAVATPSPGPPPTATPALTTPRPRPPTDVQAAVTVLGRQPPDRRLPAQLEDADLAGATLRGTHFGRADPALSRVDLIHTDLHQADLTGADLSDADARYADLRGADLRGADLHGADLRDADLTGATTDAHTRLPPGITVPSPAGPSPSSG